MKTFQLPRPSVQKAVTVDCAGAVKGGAARFLRELQSYLSLLDRPDVQLLGLGEHLSPSWLVRREFQARSSSRRIALNNAGFINPAGERITLLRNILQFATTADLERLKFTPSRRLAAQTPIVRALARSSDVLVVPCTRMADQVENVAPYLQGKITVRFHPVSRPSWVGVEPFTPYDVLLPIVPSPYKNLSLHVSEFLQETSELGNLSIRLVIPAEPDTLPSLQGHPRLKFIGPQTSEKLEDWWKSCSAVFFPVEFESFGYPLAEARVYGRHIVAQDTQQNHEIAAGALVPYKRGQRGSLRTAVIQATSSVPTSDAGPFDPVKYFDWLLAGAG